MRILIACNNFSYLSGSPLYVYTLGKELVLLGHSVTIYAPTIGGILLYKARQAGIDVVNIIPRSKFDVMHLNQKVSEKLLDIIDAPAVYSIHSEFTCEEPIRDEKIKRYIAIRPSIALKWGIDAEIIYNPIDFSRFHPFPRPKEEMTLFVGTIDTMRRKAAKHLMDSGKNVRFVGQKFDTWADGLPNYHEDTWYIEEHLKDATETAGIMLGRTTLEGFCCGLPGIIYDIDENYNIKSITRHDPPEDMSPFDSKVVAKKILQIYHDVIKI